MIEQRHREKMETEGLKQPEHGSRADVLTRCAMLKVGYLRSPTASKRDAACDELARLIDELSRIAARSENEEVLAALRRAHELGAREMDWHGTGSDQAYADNDREEYLAKVEQAFRVLDMEIPNE